MDELGYITTLSRLLVRSAAVFGDVASRPGQPGAMRDILESGDEYGLGSPTENVTVTGSTVRGVSD